MFLFIGELIAAMAFSIYVLRDALRDYRAVRSAPSRPDSLLITDMFVKTEIARLVKMFSFLAIIALSFTQPVPERVQDTWYVFLVRVLFLVIGAALAYTSVKEHRTRRKLVYRRKGEA